MPAHSAFSFCTLMLDKQTWPDQPFMCTGISENIKKGKAVGVEMCGEKLVLFRGQDGKVRF